MKKLHLLSIGTMYVDINCLHFPFQKGLFVNRETTGNEYELSLGGSALNFAKMTTQLGLDTTFIGKVGNDTMGKILIQMLTANNIKPAIIHDQHVQTNLAIHYVHDDGSSIMTSTGTANQHLMISDIRQQMDRYIDVIDYVYLGGILKLKNILPYLTDLIQFAKEKGKQVILDHGRVNNSVTKQDIQILREFLPFVDIYLPSIDEFFAVWNVRSIEEGKERVRTVSKADLIIKNGKNGAVGFSGNERIEMRAFPVDVINTVGAGDSFNAGYLCAIQHDLNFKECIKFACATAAVKISTKKESFTYYDIQQKI